MTTLATTSWINPEAPEPVLQAARSTSTEVRRGLGRPVRLGLLDNTKDNARMLLQLIGERVRQEFGAEIVARRKGNATLAAPPELLEELARDTDCVLTAMAD